MNGRKAVATGGCQCGAVRYAFYAPLENSHVCHCRMCQRATGGVFAALAGGSPDNFAWTQGTPKFFASSNLAQRGFCEKCGTPLSFQYHAAGARIYTTIEVIHRVRGRGVDPKAVAHAVELSETKYCSVSAMLAASATITSRIDVVDEE